MLFYIYWFITLIIGSFLFRLLFREQDWKVQLSAALALIPLLLRALLLK